MMLPAADSTTTARQRWLVPAVAFAMSIACGISCYVICGNSLDLFIGGTILSAIIAPPLSTIARQLPGAMLSGIMIVAGMGCVWWMGVHRDAITRWQWAQCVAVLLSLVVSMVTTTRCLIRLMPASGASAIVTIVALAWFTWPIWLSGDIAGSQLHWSIALHPLLAINGIVSNLGIWTEQQVAYNLTNLGQDVPCPLPSSAWPAIGLNLGVGMLMVVARTCGPHPLAPGFARVNPARGRG